MSDDLMTDSITFAIDTDTKERLLAKFKNEERDMSSGCRFLIKKYLKEDSE